MSRPANDQPTDGELEILKLLWELGPAELKQIHAGLQAQRKVANTTVATMLTVMLAKGLVKRKSGPRGYLWSAPSRATLPRVGSSASWSIGSSTARPSGWSPI